MTLLVVTALLIPAQPADNAPQETVEEAVSSGDPEKPWAEVHLQVRPRAEKAFNGHLGVPRFPGELAGTSNYKTTSRIRLGADAGVGIARARVTIQDVRTWASESSTLGDFSAEDIDFHEGWVQLGGGDTLFRLGRQELALDDQRLIGAVNWQQQARAFDAALFEHARDNYQVTVFATRVGDAFLHDVFAAHGAIELSGMRLAMPLIFQTNALVAAQDRGTQPDEWHRFTGGLHASSGGRLSWRGEAYVQTGSNHFAYMVGGRVGYRINAMVEPTLWVDFLSGDTDLTDDDTGAFDTLFATNHKYYGYLDRFTAIPAHTRGGGLVDISIKNRGELGPGALEVALHEFLLAAADVSPAADTDHSPLIGFEADVVYTLPLSDWVTIMAGAALFVDQGDFRAERRAASADAPTVHDWFFLMVDLKI